MKLFLKILLVLFIIYLAAVAVSTYLGNQEIKTNANNVNIYFNNNLIELSEINLNIDIFSFLKENPIIKKLEIHTKENKLKNILKIIQSYKFNFSTVLSSGIISSLKSLK